MPTTAETPKCFAEVGQRRILDWTLKALAEGGVEQVCFIGGYQIDKVREAYPHFEFRHNDNWPNNNILASLFYAEDLMDEPFICCYSDILFTTGVVQDLVQSKASMALGVDTDWLRRYEQRTEHPSDDAEKVAVENGLVTCVHRNLPEAKSHGEFIGVARFDREGADALREHYHRCRREYAGRPFREAKVFEKAYLIHLFQEMIEAGERFTHVDTHGGYIEIDTQQDFEYARAVWRG